MKKITFLIYINLIIFLMSMACVSHANTFDDIIKDGTLRVGVSLYEPWVVKNKNGDLDGFEVEIAKQIAKDMGVEIKFTEVNWDELINNLEKNKFDVIISGMAITPERALRVNFSNPYASSGVGVAACVVQTKHFKSLAELNKPGIKVAAVSETVSAQLAGKVFSDAKIQTFSTIEEAQNAIIDGNVHALVGSSSAIKFLTLTHPDRVDEPLNKPLLTYKSGMAINKGEYDFLNYLNAWITSREAEGWIESRHKYWFESLEWKNNKE